MAYPELYILRHGQTEWNAEGRLQGALNSPLTALGRQQAQTQRMILETRDLTGFDAIMSPQGRAVETAGIAVAPLVGQLTTDPRLREIEVGEWSGRQRDTLGVPYEASELPGETLGIYEAAPGGEGLDALERRCRGFLNDLTGPAVIVSHGITGRMLRALWLGVGQQGLGDLPGGQGVVFHLCDERHNVLRSAA
ncbi:MAG: histidine phosphatase family protein [Pseudomonadota bacterium]